MIQKITAEKLLKTILFENINAPCVFILSDERIFQKCVEDMLVQKTQKRPKIFEGGQSWHHYNQYICQNNLFEPMSDAIILLDETFRIKKKDECQIFLSQNQVFIFGKTILRNVIHEIPNSVIFLSFSPSVLERQKCAEILAKKYLKIAEPRQINLPKMAEEVLYCYNHDLYDCALHFERMNKSGLNFEDAKLPDALVSGFNVVHTLLEGDVALLDMRLTQYVANHDEIAQILNALIYFFKQLAHVHAELVKNPNLNLALMNAKIPYPAQDKIKKAIQVIPYAKIEHFFSVCAQLELEIRECKNPYQILFFELTQLCIE